jgi:hypothetical protein
MNSKPCKSSSKIKALKSKLYAAGINRLIGFKKGFVNLSKNNLIGLNGGIKKERITSIIMIKEISLKNN